MNPAACIVALALGGMACLWTAYRADRLCDQALTEDFTVFLASLWFIVGALIGLALIALAALGAVSIIARLAGRLMNCGVL